MDIEHLTPEERALYDSARADDETCFMVRTMLATINTLRAELKTVNALRENLTKDEIEVYCKMHNVLALIDSYQRGSMEADERIRAVCKLLSQNGCDCDCDHHYEEHDDDCERCLACRIGAALDAARKAGT